jgi:DNA-binding beta-propeller fold protein YncE
MSFKRLSVLAVLALLVAALIAPAAAQDTQIIADGLRNPRNIAFDSNNNLYVAEAGIAGPELTLNENAYGASARITRISSEGEPEVVVSGLISYREGNPLGASAVQVTDESIWVLLGETADFTIPFTHALVELDKDNGRVKTFVDMLALELDEDPDGNPNEQSNPTDFAVAEDGTIYIANAGMNALLSWTPEDGLQVVQVWDFETDNPVPTAVEIGPDGDIYVGFLTGFPFPQGGARIERWSGGELVQTYEGLTAVTGLLVTDDGTIYASEFGVFDQGWQPGRVVMVSEDGVTPVLEDVAAPYGLAQSPDGTVVVAVNSIGPDNGQILALP